MMRRGSTTATAITPPPSSRSTASKPWAHLKFIVGNGEDNIQVRIALLGVRTTEDLIEIEQEVSPRLLRHFASSVRHQQYYDTDIVTVRVDRPSD